jgi:hypothetical protein
MTSPDIDIVDKLRFWQSRAERHSHGQAPVDYVTLRQAADEIERLRNELKLILVKVVDVSNLLQKNHGETIEEIKRLRDELRKSDMMSEQEES